MPRHFSPLLLFVLFFPWQVQAKFDDDDNLFEPLNKTLLEIARTPVKELTIEELSAAHGMHIPPEHREAAEYLLEYREDRPLGDLMTAMQKYGQYTPKMAEEFSRGAMRYLLDKSFMLTRDRKLSPGDHLCRCNTRSCATISNEMYAVLGPEMASFCRVDKYGFCMESIRVNNNTNILELYCGFSHATDEQKELLDEGVYEHIHVCKSTITEGRRCCKGPMCNDSPLPVAEKLDTVLERKVKELNQSLATWRGVGISLIVTLIFLIIILILTLYFFFKYVDLEAVKKKLAAVSSSSLKRIDEAACRITLRFFSSDAGERGSTAGSESPLIPPSLLSCEGGTSMGAMCNNPSRSYLDMETTVGSHSGSGHSLVAQRTFASFIRLLHPLGQGKFGKVFLGEWRGGEKLAVKKFSASLYDAYEQELEILMSGMMSNSNILRWIGKDSVNSGTCDEFWIMSEYHPNGCLYDYMEKYSLSQNTLLMMMRGIVNGISFLHSEMGAKEGCRAKRGVAHRDLKTKNILVKSDLTCVIADFGMAVMNHEDGVKLPPGTKKSGTVRYLSPEVLMDDISHVSSDFSYYKASDMYSFALILWECARRTHGRFNNVSISEYSMNESLAYYQEVPREPSIAHMKKAVVEDKKRPPIDEKWEKHPILQEMSRIMRECWSINSTARLAALNVKLAIDRLSSELNLNLPRGYD